MPHGGAEEGLTLAAKLVEALRSSPLDPDRPELVLGASIGVTPRTEGLHTAEAAIALADAAMYRAKAAPEREPSVALETGEPAREPN